jgi:hypothetical protein
MGLRGLRRCGGAARGAGGDLLKKKRMSYDEIAKYVESTKRRWDRLDVVCFLIGYQGNVNADDWENIARLYSEKIID